MLPFLKKHDVGAQAPVTEHRKPDDSEKSEKDQTDGMHMAASDLIDAVKAEDVARAAKALRAAFEIADSEPHQESPEDEEKD
jgi:DNA-binding GntR family transcriptional regulator